MTRDFSSRANKKFYEYIEEIKAENPDIKKRAEELEEHVFSNGNIKLKNIAWEVVEIGKTPESFSVYKRFEDNVISLKGEIGNTWKGKPIYPEPELIEQIMLDINLSINENVKRNLRDSLVEYKLCQKDNMVLQKYRKLFRALIYTRKKLRNLEEKHDSRVNRYLIKRGSKDLDLYSYSKKNKFFDSIEFDSIEKAMLDFYFKKQIENISKAKRSAEYLLECYKLENTSFKDEGEKLPEKKKSWLKRTTEFVIEGFKYFSDNFFLFK